jgi:hypothetical protein
MFSLKDVVTGTKDNELKTKLQNASVSEKLGIINILSCELSNIANVAILHNKIIKKVGEILKENSVVTKSLKDAVAILDTLIKSIKNTENEKGIYFSESNEQTKEKLAISNKLSEIRDILISSDGDVKTHISDFLTTEIEQLKALVATTQKGISNTSEFLFDTFGESPELQIFISNLTVNKYTALFLMNFGCKKFSEITESKFDEKSFIKELYDLI